jgi:hypothetical protein
VGFEQIFGTRQRPVEVSALRLTHQGQPVAFHVEPALARFRPGSVLYFVSEGPALNPYGTEAVYELSLGGGGLRMPVGKATPWGDGVEWHWASTAVEQNRTFQPGLLEAPELWLWEAVSAGVTKSYTVMLSGVAPAAVSSRLEIWLQGGSDLDLAPDHHVRAHVNGWMLGEASWDGKRPHRMELELAPSVLTDGENRLDLENVGDTGAAYSVVFMDRFRVAYPRLLVAESGRLAGSFETAGAADVAGLPAGALVVDTTASTPQWLKGAVSTPSGLAFRVEAGHRYLAAVPQGLEVRRATASGLRGVEQRADYLLIAPREFLSEAQRLLDRRADEGLVTKAVAVEDVYDEFGHGEARPEAIRQFVSYAYHHWQGPAPRYVLLLGDATYDQKDHLGSGVLDRVPAKLIRTTYLWTASDPHYAAVNGEDALPDLAIGRLPARSLDEARVLLDKLIAFEEGGFDFTGPAVLVADNADKAGEFELDSEAIASLLGPRELRRVYIRDLRSGTRPAITDAFDDGASLMSYVGHGGMAVWASENVWNNSDVQQLAPQPRQPFLMTMNCLNGYFHVPTLDSLTEVLLKAEGRGALAGFSPSGLSLNEPAHVYQRALVSELVSSRHERLGDAILAAQAAYAETGAMPELLAIYHLFGDPATKLRH